MDRDPGLQTEEVRLPDGRRVVFYRFPEEPEADDAPAPPPAPAASEER